MSDLLAHSARYKMRVTSFASKRLEADLNTTCITYMAWQPAGIL